MPESAMEPPIESFDESDEDRAERITTEADRAESQVRITPGQARLLQGLNQSAYVEPTYATTAERLRARAKLIGPFGLDYISAAQMVAIADELDGMIE